MYKMIKKISNNIFNSLKAKRLLNNLNYENLKELEGKTIIIFTLRNLPVPIHIEYFLAYQLAELGANVKIIMDDGVLEHWDWIQIHDNISNYTIYKYPFFKSIPYKIRGWLAQYPYNHKNIEKVYLSELLKNHNINDVELEEKHKWQAESSTRRFFETGMLDLSKPEYRKYYEQSIYNCKVSLLTAKVIKEKFNPNLFITSHGIYSLWGPAYYYMKENNIPTLVQGQHAYKIDKLIISDTIIQLLSLDDDWKNFRKCYLSKDQIETIDIYFKERISFKAKDTNIYYGNIGKFKEVTIKKENEIVFGLFPNIIWDGDIKERDTIFNGVVDWIIKTIEIFKKSKHKLVIRFHPAEVTLWKNSIPLEKVIREKIKDIDFYSNIILISSDEKLNTYEFIKQNIDIGLIYDGVLAMEMPYLRVPVISCAISRYTGAGFVYEPKNFKEYISMLNNPEWILDDFKNNYHLKKEELFKYAYWYFYIAGYELPIFDKNIPGKINYKDIMFENIDIYKNENLKRTINKFLSVMKRN